MDYNKHYTRLCHRGQNREKKEGMYYERHHIIPRCKGGSDSKDNLTLLTAREHYIAHYLLHMMEPECKSLWYALFCMAFLKNENQGDKRYQISSRVYERLRKERREHYDISTSIRNLKKAVAAVKGKKRNKVWNRNATEAWIKKKGKCTALSREQMIELLDKYEWSAYKVSKNTEYSVPNVMKGISYHSIEYKKKEIGKKNKRGK